MQNIDFRLRKMEESSEQILNHLAVIHRFMAMHTNAQEENLQASTSNLPGDLQRIRTVSISDTENANNMHNLQVIYLTLPLFHIKFLLIHSN